MNLKLIIFTFLLLLLKYSNAQQLINPSNNWIVAERSIDGSRYLHWKTVHYYFEGDSIVNDLKYSKMWSINGSDATLSSLWREDSSSNVYFIQGIQPVEEFVYNFSFEEETMYNQFDFDFIVDSVIVKPFGTLNRKHLYIHCVDVPEFKTIWVEGVGSLSGPQVPVADFLVGGQSRLICFHENEELIFLNENYSDCDASTGTLAKTIMDKSNFIELFPIGNGEIRLNVKDKAYGEIIFYTMKGEKLLSDNICDLIRSIYLPINGIVFYSYTTNKGELQTGKIAVK